MGFKWLVNWAPKYIRYNGKERVEGGREGEGDAKILIERKSHGYDKPFYNIKWSKEHWTAIFGWTDICMLASYQ